MNKITLSCAVKIIQQMIHLQNPSNEGIISSTHSDGATFPLLQIWFNIRLIERKEFGILVFVEHNRENAK